MLYKLYSLLTSLKITILLLLMIIVLFTAGAIIMPMSHEFGDINNQPLFKWLSKTNIYTTWWVHGSIIIIFLLIINTIFCSIDSIIKKKDGKNPLLTLSPQIIHVGFCFMMLAHLISSYSSSSTKVIINEGYGIQLKSGLKIYLTKVNLKSKAKHITEMWADILYKLPNGSTGNGRLSANNPYFIKGMGIYLKDISTYPYHSAFIEISYEPGAIWALIGGICFSIGTLTFFILKLKYNKLD